MESTSQIEKAKSIYDENCPICMQLLYLPQMFPKCEHVFCKLCLQYIEETEDQLKCPLCRTPGKIEDVLPLPRL